MRITPRSSWPWAIFSATAALGFGCVAIWFIVGAIKFWLHPPDWEIYLRTSPELNYLTTGDVAFAIHGGMRSAWFLSDLGCQLPYFHGVGK